MPVCEREQWFYWSLKSGRWVRPGDYILPPLLFRAEQRQSGDPGPTAS